MNLNIDSLKRIFLVVISFVIFSGSNCFTQDVGPVQWFVVDIQGKKITNDFNVTGTIQWHYFHDIQNEGINIYYAEGISDNPADFKFLEKVRIEDAQPLSKHHFGYSFSGITGTQKTWTFAVTAYTQDGVSEFSKFYTASFKYNEPPFLVEFVTYPEKKAKVGEEYTYKPEIKTNIDKPTLEYILEDAPPNAKYNPETGEISWIPLNEEFKYFHIMLKVKLDDEVVSIIQQSWGVSFSDCDKPSKSSIIIHAKDESGNPVNTVRVTIFDYEEGVNPTTKFAKMIFTNHGASFGKVFGLDKGKYYILVDAFSKDKTIAFKSNWYNDADRLEDAVPFELGCEEEVELNVVMKHTTPPNLYWVSGKVLDKNTLEPAKIGVHFYGHSENTNELKVFNFPMKEDGTYIGKLPDTYKYTAVVHGYLYSKLHNKAKYYSQYYDMADKPEDAKLIELNSDVTGIDFYLTPVPVFDNSLYGKVVDIYDNPQIRVEVTAYKIITDSSGTEYKYQENNSFVDATGSFKFENVEPGEYILFARPSKYYNPSVYYVGNDSSALTWRNATRIKVEEYGNFGSYKIVLVPMEHILGKGKIKGIVRSGDEKGAIKSGDEVQSSDKAISGANIYLVDSKSKVTQNLTTDKFGKFELSNISAGTYNLIIDKIGFESSITEITLGEDAVIEQDIILKPSEPTEVKDVDGNIISIEVFPNPAMDFVTLKFYNTDSDAVVTLLSHTGIELQGNYVVSNQGLLIIPTNELPSGVYFVKVQKGNNFSVKPFMILR